MHQHRELCQPKLMQLEKEKERTRQNNTVMWNLGALFSFTKTIPAARFTNHYQTSHESERKCFKHVGTTTLLLGLTSAGGASPGITFNAFSGYAFRLQTITFYLPHSLTLWPEPKGGSPFLCRSLGCRDRCRLSHRLVLRPQHEDTCSSRRIRFGAWWCQSSLATEGKQMDKWPCPIMSTDCRMNW